MCKYRPNCGWVVTQFMTHLTVQEAIREKRRYKVWLGTRNIESYEIYKKAMKDAKKVVSYAKFRAYDDLYNRLETRGEKDSSKLAKIKERKIKDLDHIKCIKSNDQKGLVKDNDIKQRWREYFSKLLNEDYVRDIRTREDTLLAEQFFFFLRRISVVEVRKH